MKTCYMCGEDKPVSEFYLKSKAHPERGYQGGCRVCILERARVSEEAKVLSAPSVRTTGERTCVCGAPLPSRGGKWFCSPVCKSALITETVAAIMGTSFARAIVAMEARKTAV